MLGEGRRSESSQKIKFNQEVLLQSTTYLSWGPKTPLRTVWPISSWSGFNVIHFSEFIVIHFFFFRPNTCSTTSIRMSQWWLSAAFERSRQLTQSNVSQIIGWGVVIEALLVVEYYKMMIIGQHCSTQLSYLMVNRLELASAWANHLGTVYILRNTG